VIDHGGRALDAPLRERLESRLGHDLSHVRLHTGSAAERSARAVSADAYTVGQHVVFGAGQYNPHSAAGEQLLTHELVHTLQQPRISGSPGPLPIDAPDSPHEVEAERTAQGSARRSAAAAPAQVSRRLSHPRIQRQCPPPERRRGAAGGCGVCLGGPMAAGTLVHTLVEYAFFFKHPQLTPEGGLMERIVPTVPEGETAPFNPELDLSMVVEENGLRIIYIGEIKPFDDAGAQQGIAQRELEDYRRELQHSFDDVRLLRLDPPSDIPLIEPAYPPGCPRQKIQVCLTAPGVYQYYCAPPWADLVRDPRCRCGGRRREPERQRERQRQRDRQRDTEEDRRPQERPEQPEGYRPPVTLPEPYQPPIVVPGPETQPGAPETEPGTPETEPDGPVEEPPDNVIPFPGGRPSPAPEAEPEGEWVDQAARVGLAAIIVGALAYGVKTLGRTAARRVLVYAEALAVAALVVFYSDRVEASVGPGESPLETLFQAMESDGIPVSDELKQRIENDPQLKAALENAARTGNLSDAQRAISQQMVDVIAQNPEAFSEEDLRILAEMTEAASGGSTAAQPTVESLRRAIEAKRQGRSVGDALREGQGGGAAPETAPEAQPGTQTETPAPSGESETPAEPEETPPVPNVSPELQEALGRNREVRRLFDAMTGRSGRGPEVNDEVVRRFLDTVPDDLTAEEASRLIQGLGPIENQSLEAILGSLREAVTRIRRGEESGEAAGEPSDEATPTPEESGEVQPGPTPQPTPTPEIGPQITRSEAVQRIQAYLRRNPTPNQFPPPSQRSEGHTFTVLIAQSFNGVLIGAAATITLGTHASGNDWNATLHPADWFNAGGDFVRRWPSRPTATTVTLPRRSR